VYNENGAATYVFTVQAQLWLQSEARAERPD